MHVDVSACAESHTPTVNQHCQMTCKYGQLFRFHTILGDAVCVGTAAAIKWFLHFDGRLLDAALPAHWNPLLGARSVVAISGDVHKRLSKMLMVAFMTRALEGYVLMTQHTTAASLAEISTNKSMDYIRFLLLVIRVRGFFPAVKNGCFSRP